MADEAPILRADALDDQDEVSDGLENEVPDFLEAVSWEPYENNQGGWSYRPLY